MKNKFTVGLHHLMVIALILNFYSCAKLQVESKQDVNKLYGLLGAGDSATIYSYVWLCGDQLASPVDSGFRISAVAAFTDTVTHGLVAITSLAVNSRTLTANPDHTYDFGYSDSSIYLTEGLNLYGSNVKVKISGSSPADTVTQLIYMPKKVLRRTSDLPTGQVDITKNLTLNWTTDPACSWGNIEIKLFYNAANSVFLHDSTLSARDSALSYTVPDNGSYTISSADLQKFKKNSNVTLSLGRGSQTSAVLPISKKRIFYFATSSISSYGLTLVSGIFNGIVEGSNTGVQIFNLNLTNTVTGISYPFVMHQGTTLFTNLGSLPVGNYNATITPTFGHALGTHFFINGQSSTDWRATFTNVAITGTNYVSVD